MSVATHIPVISAVDLHNSGISTWQCIDVRSASEFASGHIPTTINIPMDEIENRLSDLKPRTPTVLICQAGTRAALTRQILAGRAGELVILDGGLNAWQQASLPTVAITRSRWSLERQVRLGAGLLVFSATLLGCLLSPVWFYLAGFVGLGLIFAGTTNFCAMARLLALLPWNRHAKSSLSPAPGGPPKSAACSIAPVGKKV